MENHVAEGDDADESENVALDSEGPSKEELSSSRDEFETSDGSGWETGVEARPVLK